MPLHLHLLATRDRPSTGYSGCPDPLEPIAVGHTPSPRLLPLLHALRLGEVDGERRHVVMRGKDGHRGADAGGGLSLRVTAPEPGSSGLHLARMVEKPDGGGAAGGYFSVQPSDSMHAFTLRSVQTRAPSPAV